MSYCIFTKEALEEFDFMSSLIDKGIDFKKLEEFPNDTIKYEINWADNPFEKDDRVNILMNMRTQSISVCLYDDTKSIILSEKIIEL